MDVEIFVEVLLQVDIVPWCWQLTNKAELSDMWTPEATKSQSQW